MKSGTSTPMAPLDPGLDHLTSHFRMKEGIAPLLSTDIWYASITSPLLPQRWRDRSWLPCSLWSSIYTVWQWSLVLEKMHHLFLDSGDDTYSSWCNWSLLRHISYVHHSQTVLSSSPLLNPLQRIPSTSHTPTTPRLPSLFPLLATTGVEWQWEGWSSGDYFLRLWHLFSLILTYLLRSEYSGLAFSSSDIQLELSLSKYHLRRLNNRQSVTNSLQSQLQYSTQLTLPIDHPLRSSPQGISSSMDPSTSLHRGFSDTLAFTPHGPSRLGPGKRRAEYARGTVSMPTSPLLGTKEVDPIWAEQVSLSD